MKTFGDFQAALRAHEADVRAGAEVRSAEIKANANKGETPNPEEKTGLLKPIKPVVGTLSPSRTNLGVRPKQ